MERKLCVEFPVRTGHSLHELTAAALEAYKLRKCTFFCLSHKAQALTDSSHIFMEIKDPLACYLVQLLFPANELQQREVFEIGDRLHTPPRRSLFYHLLKWQGYSCCMC